MPNGFDFANRLSVDGGVNMKSCMAARSATSAIILAIGSLLMVGGALAQGQSPVPSGADNNSKPVATPRTADGHPDLTGDWSVNFLSVIAKGEVSPDGKERAVLFAAPNGDVKNIGNGDPAARRAANKNKPPYKPELVKKWEALDDDSNHTDPTAFSCLPPGVPRIGAPSQILQTPGWVVFFYASQDRTRLIPTDGRPHLDADPSYLGDSVGHWEGDTLVVDVTHLNDQTWFGPGYFHSEAMHVVERFTRVGNSIKYEVTVDDPNVLTQAWNMTPRNLKLAGPFAQIEEDPPCVDRDQGHLVTNQVN